MIDIITTKVKKSKSKRWTFSFETVLDLVNSLFWQSFSFVWMLHLRLLKFQNLGKIPADGLKGIKQLKMLHEKKGGT